MGRLLALDWHVGRSASAWAARGIILELSALLFLVSVPETLISLVCYAAWVLGFLLLKAGFIDQQHLITWELITNQNLRPNASTTESEPASQVCTVKSEEHFLQPS